MIRYFLHYSFLVPAILFGLHQALQHLFHLKIHFLDNYLDPFCFSAIFLMIYQWQRSWWVEGERIQMLEIIAWVFMLSFISEVLFPLLSVAFTPDWYDVLSITIGGAWFAFTRVES
ncbi:MAG: hypothetical protein DCO95_03030 [Roseivirga sp. XM-24bin3]|nr:MAG: hypothetical protein DCO95_03030 [Roseivirga sp. XM-24bin3]